MLATAAVIVIGEAETSWRSLRRLTSFGPIQVLGRVRYSAYLWHYPLIIGTAAVIGHLSGVVKAALFVATALLAFCSQRLIEEPARRWLTTKLQAGPVLVGTGCAMVVALVVCLGATAHIDARADAAASQLRVDSARPSGCFGAQAALSGAACPSSHQLQTHDDLLVKAEMHGPSDMLHSVQYREVSVRGVPLGVYEFGASIRSATDTVALVGDSHAAMWWPALDVVARRNKVHVVSVTRQGCVLTLDENVPGRPGETDCRQWRAAALDYVVDSDRIDRVIVAGRGMLYVDDDGQPAGSTGYVAAWRAIMRAGKHVVVVADVPDYGLPPVQCPAGGTATDCGMPRSQIADTGWSDAAAAIPPGPLFSLADFNDLLCDVRVCHTIVGGIPAYADSNHLSSYFVRSIGEPFYDRVLSRTDH